MNLSKLNLNQEIIDSSRQSAKNIADEVQKFIDLHTTVSTERAILRLLGVDGVDDIDKPLPNVVVDSIRLNRELEKGVAYWIGNAMLNTHLTPQQIAEKISIGELEITSLPIQDEDKIKNVIEKAAKPTIEKIKFNKIKREELGCQSSFSTPLIYVIVATGNIYEDIVQAKAAAKQGADVIAVIRTTGQSLLDYVPYGATTEGFGGTYATQENFRLMRQALDEVGEEIGKYIRLTNYCSGLCMPEIAAMGAVERLDMMLNDALYGILFRDINMQRTLIDQYFSRVINGFAGIIINTGEDNYLTTDDAVEAAHTVLASQFINEQFALKAGIPEEQMGLGHAFEMDPDLENGFLLELAQAQMAREIFPKAPLKYMPPTKYMTGNIFKGHLQDAMFNLASIMTKQGIQLLGMPTEAIHTPHLHDRYLSIENAKYIFKDARNLGDEIEFKKDGIIQNRAKEVLLKANELLVEIDSEGLFKAIEKGKFGGVKRSPTGGKGLDGVVMKDEKYFNPFIVSMLGGERR
ncbi:lysine 5,6-aminomutase subunit alpha [Tissierellaceae bacterium BX21]|uniref:Lysine 5,6-aminomutase subunit alpha n=1 Tax=Paratissierella segnis TaxID=2763679 RepID=A0A926EUM9_9FIRM|nr:lysine 5,6-aminomutase subunit alpha [Paratissierella segnis]